MEKVFISYRRIDSYETNRLAAELKDEYGSNNIFLDIRSLGGGDIWPERLQTNIENASVLIVVIGKNWLFLQDEETGKRRIDMPDDWVRKEIITFLNRRKDDSNLLLIPLLINGAKMPRKEHLDAEINELCDLHAIELLQTMTDVDFVQLKNKLLQAQIFARAPSLVTTPVGETPPATLTTAQENEFVTANPLWQIKEKDNPDSIGDSIRELYRVYEFKDHDDAWRFMSIIHEKIIKPNNHHPRWQNTCYRVEIWLSTFNIWYKPSARDLKLAEKIEACWKEFVKGL